MKYKMDQDDIKIIQYDLEHNRTLKHLKNTSFFKFTEGDILIREERYRKAPDVYEWKPYMADCGLPYKYMYAFENELGIGYIRRLSINGRKFVERPVCVLEFDPTQTKFSLDPEYADHILLAPDDATFDAKSRYDEIKKKREQMHRKNKKLRLCLNSVDDINPFLNNLPIGTQIWYGYSSSQVRKEPALITGKTTASDPANSYFSYSWPPQNYEYKFYPKHTVKGISASYCVYLTRPLFFDELPT